MSVLGVNMSSRFFRSINKLLKSYGVDLNPLFKLTSSLMLPTLAPGATFSRQPSSIGAPTDFFDSIVFPQLSQFFQIDVDEDQMEKLASDLRNEQPIVAAYIKPYAGVPTFTTNLPSHSNATLPAMITPDFSDRQGYLLSAPGGIGAHYAWKFEGGRGFDTRIIDVEYGWGFSHEDLSQNQGGLIAGDQFEPFHNHGTSVLGIISADANAFGVTGICPDANVSAVSGWMNGRETTATAIVKATERLRPGDIMLLELHRPGPRFNFTQDRGQQGFIPVEWWPDDLAAIQYAVGRGVIVVAAAGNGQENLDDAIYDQKPIGFPANWINPFKRKGVDSGAITVGAGAPPNGTHGLTIADPDRSRLAFSNYGEMVDAQGWGMAVTTTGGGDLQGGNDEDRWYTDSFNGTSSATPMVVGALACVQGVLRWLGRPRLTPAEARELLRTTGSPQDDAPNRLASQQRIGNRPDIHEMLDVLGVKLGDVPNVPVFEGFDVP
jgi:hypothetical protein